MATEPDDSHPVPSKHTNSVSAGGYGSARRALASAPSSASAQITLRLAWRASRRCFAACVNKSSQYGTNCVIPHGGYVAEDDTPPNLRPIHAAPPTSSPLTATPASVPPRVSNGESPVTLPLRNLRPSRTVPRISSALRGTPARMDNDTLSDSPSAYDVEGGFASELLGYEADEDDDVGDLDSDEEVDEDGDDSDDHKTFRRHVRVAAVKRAEGNRRKGGILTQKATRKAFNDWTTFARAKKQNKDDIIYFCSSTTTRPVFS
ncbi:hypothetical protein GGX14DRAFT_629923 [Mycena pura]|uniref:Uncharacterized protein n=1 Tax=Mycena pura TaxID=153505 RepID=A0AAD6YRX9_9AGAR|nr:hypothetical protein GGX14DRAFT_629923 [Mycena pura]